MDNSSALLIRVMAFAAHKHRNQRRKDADASPYINHPIALANVLANEAGIDDPVVLAAALLHDTIEDTDTDTDTTRAEIEAEFGPAIAAVIAEVTDDKSLPKADRKRLQVEHAAHISQRAKLVKLADKICNLRDIASSPPADWSIERKREYFDWARSVVDQMRGSHVVLEKLFEVAHGARPWSFGGRGGGLRRKFTMNSSLLRFFDRHWSYIVTDVRSLLPLLAAVIAIDARDCIVLDPAPALANPWLGADLPVTIVVGSLAGRMIQREHNLTADDIRAALKYVVELAEHKSFAAIPPYVFMRF